MSRKAEIQAAEIAVDSPLRRSSRNVNVNSPAPAAVNTKKKTQTQNENTEATGPKTRRASLSQENSEQKETKPATRGRRASTTKEDTEPKAEPAKTRSRRSSAATEPASEEKKPQTVTRRRRSSATEDAQDTATVKPVRTRRGSSTEKSLEDESVKKTTRTKKTLAKDEHKEEPVQRTTRSRRGSVDKLEDSEEKKPITRGRRSSTDKLDSEPEVKAVKLTPIKSKRRPSITENISSLEPIKELESEIKIRNSSSPIIKQPILNLTPVDAEHKENLNLSVINESSFSEEIQEQEDRHDNCAGTLRRSPRLNKSNSAEKLTSSKTRKIDMDTQEQDQDVMDKNEAGIEIGSEIEKFSETSPKTSESISNAEIEVKDEVSPSPIDTVTSKQDQLKNSEITEQEEIDNSETLTAETWSGSMGDMSAATISSMQNEVGSENEDLLNSSKSSTSSDKENVNTNVVTSQNPKKVVADEKEQDLCTLTNLTKNKNIVQQEVVVARVSNVFRPQMKENSFMEPMDVDEYPSMLDGEQEDSQTLKIDVSVKSPRVENKEKPLNKKLLNESFVDTQDELMNESFNLCLSNVEKNTAKNSIEGEDFPENEEQVKEKQTVDEKIEESNEKKPVEKVGNIGQAKEEMDKTPEETNKLHVEEMNDEENSILENTKSPKDNESISVDPLNQDQKVTQISKSFQQSTPEYQEGSYTKTEKIYVENKSELNTEENRSRSPSFLIIQKDCKKPDATNAKLTLKKDMEKEEPLSKCISDETEDHKESSTQLLRSSKMTEDKLTLEKDKELKKSKSPPSATEYTATNFESPETKKCGSKPKDIILKRSKSSKYDTDNNKGQDIDRDTKQSSQEQLLNIDVKVDKTSSSSKTMKEESVQETSSEHSQSPEKLNLSNNPIEQFQKETICLNMSRDFLKNPEEEKVKTTNVNHSILETDSQIQEHEEKQEESINILDNSFSKMETLNVKNIKITDIEREIRRRSRSPSFQRESDYSQLNESTVDTTLDPIQLKEETETQIQKRRIVPDTNEQISLIETDAETSKDLSQVSENTPTDCIQLKEDVKLPSEQSVDFKQKHESSQAEPLLEEVNASPFEDTEKLEPSDDYDFKVPSDEEETDGIHISGYDKSTIVASFITDDSVSMAMQTVIVADKKKTVGDGIESKEIIKLNIDIEQEMEDNFIDKDKSHNEEYEKTNSNAKLSSPILKEKSKKRTSKCNKKLIDGDEIIDEKSQKASPSLKKKSKKDIFKADNESEESEENITNLKISKIEKIQNVDTAEQLPSVTQEMEDNFIDEDQRHNEEYEKSDFYEKPSSPILKEKSKKRTSKYNKKLTDSDKIIDIEESQKASPNLKKQSKKDIFKVDNESEESEDNITNIKTSKIENIENVDTAEQLPSVTPKKKSRRIFSKQVNEFDNSEGQLNNENQKVDTGKMSSSSSSKKKLRKMLRRSKEFEKDIEENTDMKSPQKKIKMRKYSLTKEIDSYEESMEKLNEGSEDTEGSENGTELPKRKNLRKRTTTVHEQKTGKEHNTSDDIEAELDVKSVKRKSKNLNLKRQIDEDVVNLTSPKKKKVCKESVTEKYENIEKTKKNKKKNSAISEDTSEESIDELDDLPQSIDFNKTSSKDLKTKKKNEDTSCVKKDKKCQEIVDDSKQKSLSSMLDDFVSQQLLELSSGDEFSSEDEHPEEPNDFVCTMAEEGEEDTPSEDSNAIIDEGESINSTDTEYGSEDNELDEDDSFICDDEEEQLLSGEEYDLGEEKTKKKSRIIPLDDFDEEIIEIQKKEKIKPAKKKRTRIISLSESSDSEENEVEPCNDTSFEKTVSPSIQSSESQEVICVEDKTDEEVFIVETKPFKSSPNADTNKNLDAQQTSDKRRLSSITIHENIDVKEIKDAALSGRISQIVDSFCTTMNKGEISMNLSIECLIKDDLTADGEKVEKAKPASSSDIDFIENEEEDVNLERETSYSPPKRLSVSMSDVGHLKKKAKKKRKLSKSMDHLDQIQPKTKKNKLEKKNKKSVEKKKVKGTRSKIPSEDQLRVRSFGLLNQLITDLKNRPRRIVRPSTHLNNSWLTEIVDIKPSTSAFDKEEKAAYKARKVHTKDFRSQMLNDPSRVRRVETKTLLRKKGVYM